MSPLAGTDASPVPQPLGLDWVLDPVPVDAFFRSYWETKPLLVRRAEPDHFAALPGLDDVDEIITATAVGSAASVENGSLVLTDSSGARTQRPMRLLADGAPDIQDVYREYHGGSTVVVNQLDRRSAPLAQLCRTLESELHHRVTANLYLTPKGSQGFPPHIDNHDVFILQIHGVKEWHVGEPLSELPLAEADHGDMEFTGAESAYTLAAGDALYLHRGFPHKAVAASSSSLHFTVAVQPYMWADVLAEALRLLAHERVEFRRGLPPGFLDAPVDPANLARLAGDLAAALADGSLAERATRRLGDRLLAAGAGAHHGQFRSIDAASSLTDESTVSRVPGAFCRARAKAGRALIEFATNYVSGPLHLAPAMKFIATHERFVVGDLPGDMSARERIDLVCRLVSEGLLLCTATAPESEDQ